MTRRVVVIMIVILALVLALITYFFRAQLFVTYPEPPVSSEIEPPSIPNPSQHNFRDIDFAKKMIVHNQQALQIIDVAQAKLTKPDLQSLAESISSEKTSEVSRYIAWLEEWGESYMNLSDFPEMEGHDMYPTHPGMANLAEIRSISSASPVDAERIFLELMIIHHEGAIEMANDVGARVQYGEMITLRDASVERLKSQIITMKSLQKQGE